MEVVINISDEQFKNVLQKELQSFSDEELKEICRKGIVQCISDPNTFKYLFIKEKYSNGGYEANEVLREAAKTINFDEAFTDLQKDIVKYIKENFNDILLELCKEAFIKGFSRNIIHNNDFVSNLKYALSNS